MKLRQFALFLCVVLAGGVFSTCSRADGAAAAKLSNSLTLEIHSEVPSNLFWDSDTMDTHRPILLSWRVSSLRKEPAKIQVSWRILDAAGKRVLDGDSKYDVEGGGYADGRQLFSPKARGAYLWVVQAHVKLDGPDINKTVALPFAVVAKPDSSENPFLSLNTPAAPDARSSDFYQRIGAQTWRSPVDNQQMAWREQQHIETIGVLAATDDGNSAIISQNPGIFSWEYSSSDDVSLSDLLALPQSAPILNQLSSVNVSRPPSIALQGLWPEKVALPSGVNRFLLQLPVPDDDVNVAARRRTILFAQSMAAQAGFAGFTLHNRDDLSSNPSSISPRESAAALAENVVLARTSGAQGYSVSLNPRVKPFENAINFEFASDDTHQLIPWERATAFAAANRILGNAEFVKELFPDTPAVYASLFKKENSCIAVLWSAQDDEGRLELHLPGATLMDADGNTIAQADNKGNLKVPLTDQCYYLQADVSPEDMARALRAAAIKGVAPVRAQVLPLTQLVERQGITPGSMQIQVRLQNITPHPCSGMLTVQPPGDWKLEHYSQQFVLTPGEWRIYAFKVIQGRSAYDYSMGIKVQVNNGVTGQWSWDQTPPLATATNLPPESHFKLDGDLDDWEDATWMNAENHEFHRKAKLAVRWDNHFLYIAAKVREPHFQTRQGNDGPYRFWDSDAIQLGFGWRDQPWMQPSDTSFRDTDYGFVLAPFGQLSNGSIDGRVLALWSPTVPFGGAVDHQRWGGAVMGATCRIRFDSKKGEATYEAAIPLSALDGLNPASRIGTTASVDAPIRFSWIAHTYDGVPVQWSETAGVYPWWGNSGSFLPARKAFLAAQGLLGFTQRDVAGGADAKAPPIKTSPANTNKEPSTHNAPPAPLPPMPPQPQQPSKPAPPQNQVPSLPFPVPVQPIPPNLLPPAPPAG